MGDDFLKREKGRGMGLLIFAVSESMDCMHVLWAERPWD